MAHDDFRSETDKPDYDPKYAGMSINQMNDLDRKKPKMMPIETYIQAYPAYPAYPEMIKPIPLGGYHTVKPSEPEKVVADNGGLRYSEGKPRYDLIPPEFMEAIAIHFAQGARKYADRNWERGMSWNTCFRALMSHAWKWFRGERYDEDPSMPGYKAPHLVAVAWNAMVLYTYEQRKIGKDDRVIIEKEPT